MDKKRNWKAWFTIALLIVSVLQLLPTFLPGLPDFYTNIFEKQISYGLDLKGGLELRYTVDYKKAIRDNALRLRDSVSDRLADSYAKAKGKDWNTLTDKEREDILARWEVKLQPGAFKDLSVKFKDAADAKLLTSDMVATVDSSFQLRTVSATEMTLFLPDKRVFELRKDIVDQTLSTIRKRVDAFGLVEPDVRASGEAEIDLQLPGLNERQMRMVRERIGPVAAFKQATVIKRLPKTRSGKVLRGTMQKIADGVDYKMPATIEDPTVLGEIEEALRPMGYAKKP